MLGQDRSLEWVGIRCLVEQVNLNSDKGALCRDTDSLDWSKKIHPGSLWLCWKRFKSLCLQPVQVVLVKNQAYGR